MTVTYSGSKKQWDAITKGSYNGVLENHLVCNTLEATFTADGTTFAPAQTIDRGGKFTEPAAPSKENHTFAGWYNGDEKFDFDADTTNAPNVLNLVAKWDINQYTVQFVSDYGSFADQTVEHGKPIETDKLTIPEVEALHSMAGMPTIPTPQSLTSALPSRAIPKFTPSGKRTRLSFRIPMR